jgi:hypothetical protein
MDSLVVKSGFATPLDASQQDPGTPVSSESIRLLEHCAPGASTPRGSRRLGNIDTSKYV